MSQRSALSLSSSPPWMTSRMRSYSYSTSSSRFGGSGLATCRVMYELKGAVKLGPPRAPFVALSAAQTAALKAELTAVGYFEWCDHVIRDIA